MQSWSVGEEWVVESIPEEAKQERAKDPDRSKGQTQSEPRMP